jgi:hypothetical protein
MDELTVVSPWAYNNMLNIVEIPNFAVLEHLFLDSLKQYVKQVWRRHFRQVARFLLPIRLLGRY